jgi:protein-tyrosine phosphatase
MTRHLLVVCTANVCRSPVAEHLLRQRLADRCDGDGESWVVHSAGIGRYRMEVDAQTRRAVAPFGVDLSGHRPRVLDAATVVTEGANLVLTMTREHLRTVAALVPQAWPRTFTLKELARRSGATGPPRPGESVPAWLQRLSAGRKAGHLLQPDASDDVADPYGLSQRHYDVMVSEVRDAIDVLLSTLWAGRIRGRSSPTTTSPDATGQSEHR